MNKNITLLEEVATNSLQRELTGVDLDIDQLINILTYIKSYEDVVQDMDINNAEKVDTVVQHICCDLNDKFLEHLYDTGTNSKVDCINSMKLVDSSIDKVIETITNAEYVIVSPMVMTALQAMPDSTYARSTNKNLFKTMSATYVGITNGRLKVYMSPFITGSIAIVGNKDLESHTIAFENINFLTMFPEEDVV